MAWQSADVEDLPTGVYEQLITHDLVRRIGDLRHETTAVDDAEAPATSPTT
jgi:hypothetical protein